MALNKNGFSRKTYSDLLDEMEEKFKEQFGENINLSSYTPLGIIMRVMAFFYAKLWDVVEAVYNSRFIKKADGISLDYHGGDKNIPRNPATNSYVPLHFTGSPGYIIQAEETYSTDGDIQFSLLDDVTLDESGNGTGQAISVDTGSFTKVSANTITNIVNPVEEIYSVTNPVTATGGSDMESLTSYRNRLLKANESNGKGTASAIELALRNVPGVRSANVIYNKSMEVDSDGNPPKSVHPYVLGGTKESVAQALFDSISATTQTVGEQSVLITDNSLNTHDIRFDFASVVPVFAKLEVQTNAEFEADGIEQLKDALITVIGGIDSTEEEQQGLSMGSNVILARLYSAAYKVAGIEDITIQIGLSEETLNTENIIISQMQVAELSLDDIEVVINA